MESLKIQNFCGLNNARLELAPINLFIGPQATGKSVAAKLVYYFREAISGLRTFAHAQTEWKVVREKLSERLANYFGVDEVGATSFALDYEICDCTLRVHRGDSIHAKIKFDASEFFSDTYAELLALSRGANISGEASEEPAQADMAALLAQRFSELVTPVLGGAATYEQLFVPAARASLALLPTQLLGQIAGRKDLDVWMPKFADLLSGTRNTLKRLGFYGEKPTLGNERTEKLVSQYRKSIQPVLRAEVEFDGEAERLRLDDGRVISMLRASSGQQESLPLLLVLGRFTALHHVEGRSVFIEEPEAHLWPGAQRQIMHLLAEMFHRRQDQMQLLLTTHSPYVLSTVNNLLEAGRRYAALEAQMLNAPKSRQTKLAARRKQLEAIVPQRRVLSPGSVAAWQFNEGSATKLLDNEFGILGADLLDAVSDELDSDWNQLQEIGE